MRQQYHFRKQDNDTHIWDVNKLLEEASSLPTIEVSLEDITEFNQAYWYELGGASPTCQNIVEHIKLINLCDLSYPILLCHQGRLIDGMHRVCKAHLQGQSQIKAVRLPKYIEPHFINIDASELSY
jgi:hypothetical protein